MRTIVLFAIAVVLVSVAGCKDDNPSNTIKPEITSVNFTDGPTIAAGDSLKVSASFTDDLGLSEAFFEVHNNFNGHSHQKVNQKFSDSKIVTLSGTQMATNVGFEVPGNAAAGPYHLEVSVLDEDGNRSDVKVLSFDITQPGQPVFKNLPDMLEVNAGSTFNIAFVVEDDIDLKEVSYVVQQHGTSGEAPLFDGDIDLDGADDTSYSFDQDFSTGGVTGELEFIVRATDSDGNLTVGEVEIDVK